MDKKMGNSMEIGNKVRASVGEFDRVSIGV